MASTQIYLQVTNTNLTTISLTNRPVSSTTADRFLNQLSLPEEAKERDRIRASSTKTEAFPSQFYSKNSHC